MDGWRFRALQGGITAGVFLLPLSMIRDMSGFRYISFASIFALIYTGLVLIVELPSYVSANYEHADLVPFYFDWNFFTGASLTFFSYTCQVQLFPIYSELIRPDPRRIKKVIVRSIAVDLGFYLVIAAAGYFSTYDMTPKIVLNRPLLAGIGRDYAILVA